MSTAFTSAETGAGLAAATVFGAAWARTACPGTTNARAAAPVSATDLIRIFLSLPTQVYGPSIAPARRTAIPA